jgi:SAM-dependent methyltransferase
MSQADTDQIQNSSCGCAVSGDRQPLPTDSEHLVETVKKRYGRIAKSVWSGCCGSPVEAGAPQPDSAAARTLGYEAEELEAVPEGTNLGLGCGAPVKHLHLKPGETVLDLGSGPGFDALLAARIVGPRGLVIGVDMTPEMNERARTNARDVGVSHVDFRQGRLEQLPVDDATVDAVTSNCVINLVPDKQRVFDEIARVMRPGGRLVISDIVLDGELPRSIQDDLLSYVGCVAGAMQRDRYMTRVLAAGLSGIELLSDVDFLGAVGDSLPPDVVGLLDRTGVDLEELRGKVRSITFRAFKP